MTLPTDPAHDQVGAPTEHAQPGVATRPRLTLSAAAQACAVSRSTLRRRLAQGAFPHAARDAAGTWTVPVGDLLAAGLRINAPQVAGAQAPPVVSRVSGPAHQLPASLVEQGHSGAGEQALAIRVAELEQALAVAEMRAAGPMVVAVGGLGGTTMGLSGGSSHRRHPGRASTARHCLISAVQTVSFIQKSLVGTSLTRVCPGQGTVSDLDSGVLNNPRYVPAVPPLPAVPPACQSRGGLLELRCGAASAGLSRPVTMSIVATLRLGTTEVVTVAWSSQPADYRDDELDLVDDYDPELDLLDDLCDLDED